MEKDYRQFPFEQITAYIEREFPRYNLAGLSVSISDDKGTLYEKGFGLRDVERKLPVDEHTLFMLASVTKAFTACAMGMLVDEEKLTFDSVMSEVLPFFRLQDDYANRHVTVRDTLNHCTGMPRHDLTWALQRDLTRRQYVELIRHLKPAYPIRTKYHYNNLMFLSNAMLIEVLTGQTWEEFTQRRIFDKLGMGESGFRVSYFDGKPNVAKGYDKKNGAFRLLRYLDVPNSGGDGNIISSAHDMAKWLTFHLSGGKAGEQPLLTPDTFKELHTGQFKVNAGRVLFPQRKNDVYGYGFNHFHLDGMYLLEHGGNDTGFATVCSLMPEEKLGVCILTNGDHDMYHYGLVYAIYQMLLGRQPDDWTGTVDEIVKSFEEQAAKQAEERKQATCPDKKPLHEPGEYVGLYEHPAYGRADVTLRGDTLMIRIGTEMLCAGHLNYDNFNVALEDEPDMSVPARFVTAPDGKVCAFEADMEPAIGEYIRFVRVN